MEEEVRRVKVNVTFENFEGQDEVSSEASAFQREEVELARRWTLSSLFIPALSVGALASIAYSRCGLTIAQYSEINAVLDSAQKDLWTMISNHIAIFAASLQFTDEV